MEGSKMTLTKEAMAEAEQFLINNALFSERYRREVVISSLATALKCAKDTAHKQTMQESFKLGVLHGRAEAFAEVMAALENKNTFDNGFDTAFISSSHGTTPHLHWSPINWDRARLVETHEYVKKLAIIALLKEMKK